MSPIASLLICASYAAFSAAAGAGEVSAAPVSFVRDVAPILVGKCQACHGPKTTESNYRVDSFHALQQAGDYGTPPVTAGKLDESELFRLITSDDAEERMPNNGDRLADAEIRIIESWIVQGAAFDGQDVQASLQSQIPRDLPFPAAPRTYPSAQPVTALAWTSDGNRLVTSGYHELLMWDPTTGVLVARIGNVPQRTFGLAFTPDGAWLAVAGGSPGVSGDLRLIPWHADAPTSSAPTVLAKHDDVFFDVAFRPDGLQLAAAAADGTIRVFDVAAATERLKIEAHADWVTDLCYSSDGKLLASASRDKTAKVFDADAGTLLAAYSEHNAPVRAVAFDAGGKHVLSAGANSVHIWKVEDAKLVGDVGGFPGEVAAIAAGGEVAAAVSADGTIRRFRIADREVVRAITDHPQMIVSLATHEPSHRLGVGSLDGAVAVWDLESGQLVKQFPATPPADEPSQ